MSAPERWGPRGFIAVGWVLTLWLALRDNPLDWNTPGALDAWLKDRAPWVSLACCLPQLAAVLWLGNAAPARERPPAPRGWPGAALRGCALCLLLSATLTLYQLVGGHAVFWIHEFTAVSVAALLSLPLGLLTIVETRPAATHRARWGWTAIAGGGAVGALLVAWVQSEYLYALYDKGLDAATERALLAARWLTQDLTWTAWHFGWVGVVWAAVLGARLRERGRRQELTLAWAGASAAWVVPHTPAADAVIATTHLLLCVLAPLAFSIGDWLQARGATRLTPQD